MCFMENIGSFSVLPDILVTEELDRHLLLQFESLLQAVSFMGNSHPNTHVLPGIRHGPAINRISSSSLSSVGSRSESSSSNASKPVGAIQQLCSIVTFILGGPMPPTPGNIPLCWEELVDWTEEATILAEVSRSRDFIFNNAKRSRKHSTNSNVRFVAYVAAHETEDALKNLASQTYMERVQFYQESVRICWLREKAEQFLSPAFLIYLPLSTFYMLSMASTRSSLQSQMMMIMFSVLFLSFNFVAILRFCVVSQIRKL